MRSHIYEYKRQAVPTNCVSYREAELNRIDAGGGGGILSSDREYEKAIRLASVKHSKLERMIPGCARFLFSRHESMMPSSAVRMRGWKR